MDKRCDRKKDCSDGSDEKDCVMVHRSKKVPKGFLDKKLLRDASYNQLLTPIPSDTEDLVKVYVDIGNDHVDDIDIDLPDQHPIPW